MNNEQAYVGSKPLRRNPVHGERRDSGNGCVAQKQVSHASHSSLFKLRFSGSQQDGSPKLTRSTAMSSVIPASRVSVNFAAVKTRQRAAWSTGNYAVVGTTLPTETKPCGA
jgi:hypothetical protein